jgi:hypothetical protein
MKENPSETKFGKQKPCEECPWENETACKVEDIISKRMKVADIVDVAKVKITQVTHEEFDKLVAGDINSGVYYSDEEDPFPYAFEAKAGKLIVEDENGEDFMPSDCPLLKDDPSMYEKTLKMIGQIRRYALKYIPDMPKISMPKIPGSRKKK